MPGSFQSQNEIFQTFPEQKYFQNCIVIGELPVDINLDQLFSFFHDIPYWKKGSRKLISDPLNPHMKAVVISYDNEKLASLCAFRVRQAISRTSFILYDGNFLFLQCKHLDEDCDSRSRNVAISGFDTNVPKNMYLDLFKLFGTLNYFEFCVNGEISKARFEYTRATSAFAAVLCLQGALSTETLITMEMPLFPISAIGTVAKPNQAYGSCFAENGTEVPISTTPMSSCDSYSAINETERKVALSCNENQPTEPVVTATPLYLSPLASYEGYFRSVAEKLPTLPMGYYDKHSSVPAFWTQPREEFRSQCFMVWNTLSCHPSVGRWEEAVLEDSVRHQPVEECAMGTLSFEISRKVLRERGAIRHLSKEIIDNFDKDESLSVFLRAAKRKFIF